MKLKNNKPIKYAIISLDCEWYNVHNIKIYSKRTYTQLVTNGNWIGNFFFHF